MWMTRVAIKNPVFCTMVMFALMVMGAVSYFRLPIDAMPEVNLPFAFTVVQYPGASPQAVESATNSRRFVPAFQKRQKSRSSRRRIVMMIAPWCRLV